MSPTPPGSAAPSSAPVAPAAAAAPLDVRVAALGRQLGPLLERVLDGDAPGGPQKLATRLGLDKVFASRLLKALRSKDPIALAYHLPGPEPMRRFLSAAEKHGAAAGDVRAAREALQRFHELVRAEVGDRSAFEAVVSAWLPEVRKEFETRRKQAAYRAASQLKGVSAETTLATVLLHPSESGRRVDVVWLLGFLGLRRLHAGAVVKLTTRRVLAEEPNRRPTTLDGEPVDGLEGLRLDRFCHAPPSPLEVRRVGDTVHYLLGGEDFGPRSAVDLVLGERNREEMPRWLPAGTRRKSYVFAEVNVPSRSLLFDVLVHDDLYPGSQPELYLYDTAFEGIADVNDRGRDVDRLRTSESIRFLGRGVDHLRARDVPNHVELVSHAFERVGQDPRRFRCFRCRIEHPLYGSQVTVAFDCPPEP